MRGCILLFLFGTCCPGFGQNFKDVLASMQHLYKDTEKMHVVMNIKAYEKAGDPKPFFEQRAVVKRQGFNYTYNYGDMEMLMNERCLIMIDHESREITYRPRNDKSEQASAVMSNYNFDLDSMLSFYDTPQYLGNKNGTDHYRLLQKTGDVKQIDFDVLPQSMLIKQLSYTYTEGQLVNIDFVKFESNPVFTVEQFDESRILTRLKGKFITTAAFLNYRVAMTETELNK